MYLKLFKNIPNMQLTLATTLSPTSMQGIRPLKLAEMRETIGTIYVILDPPRTCPSWGFYPISGLWPCSNQ